MAQLIKHIANEETDPLTPLLDDYYLKRDRSPKRLRNFTVDLQPRPRPLGRFSPSRLMTCERQAAFGFLGVDGKRAVDPQQQAIFDDGNWRHYKWDATFLDMALVLGPSRFRVISIEEPVEIPELFIAGTLDACVWIKGKLWVVDFKGANQWSWNKVFQDHKPIEAHVLQLIAYLKARKVRRGMMLYDDKNTQRTAIFTVQFNAKQWREVEQWLERVMLKMLDRRLPPKTLECQSGTLLSEKCPYSYLCFSEKHDDQVRKLAYRDFDSLESLWERGHKILDDFDA